MAKQTKSKSFRRSYREFRLWGGLVGGPRPGHQIIIAAFGSTRREVAEILRQWPTEPIVDESRLQKVTVLEGWGDATKATRITLRNKPGA